MQQSFDIMPYIREANYAIRPAFRLGERNLLDYIIFYMQEGFIEVETGGKVYVVEEGEFCFIHPGTIHTLEGKANTISPFVHLDLFYHPQRADSFITRPGQLDVKEFKHLMQPALHEVFPGLHVPIQIKLKHASKMKDSLLKMIELWQTPSYVSKLEANLLAYEWIVAIIKQFSEPVTVQLQAMPLLNWIMSYFSFHISEPLSVKDMANRAQLSVSQFTLLFKKSFGTTPHQYLLKMRIKYAKELLLQNVSVQQISEYCGFSDIHHFSRTFKRITGVNPSTYRHRL
jgi:AraC-like DNA-binding protein